MLDGKSAPQKLESRSLFLFPDRFERRNIIKSRNQFDHERYVGGNNGTKAIWYFFEKMLENVNMEHFHVQGNFSVLILIFIPGQICDFVVETVNFHMYHDQIYCLEDVAKL